MQNLTNMGIGWPARAATPAWFFATAAFGLCSVACDTAPTQPTQAATTPKLQDLYSRELELPTVAPGAECPVTPTQTVESGSTSKQDEIPTYGYGTWPVFLSGQDRWFAGEAALLLISPEYDGPLIVRGHQLDGSGGMPLQSTSDAHSSPVGALGVEFSPPHSATRWREWDGQITPGIAPGCYGLQADGFTFTTLIVFAIQPGPPPPS